MTREKAIESLRAGNPKEWAALRKDVPFGELPSLAEADLTGCKNLNGFDLTRLDLHGANLCGVKLEGAQLQDADLRRATLEHASMGGARLDGAELSYARFDDAELVGAHLSNATAVGAIFDRADMTNANLASSNLWGASLRHAILVHANGSRPDLTKVDAYGANFRKARLEESDLTDCILTNTRMDSKTSLDNPVSTTGCKIDRVSLLSLRDFGGLTAFDLMSMTVDDGAATLRSSYSGFRQWVHVIALVAFLSPYAWFIVANSTRAELMSDVAETIPMYRALSYYLLTGGEDWRRGLHPNAFAIGLVIYAFFYNFFRFALVWKTKQLELNAEVRGLPPLLELTGFWYVLHRFAAVWGLLVNIVVVIVHSVIFMGRPIPL